MTAQGLPNKTGRPGDCNFHPGKLHCRHTTRFT
jgi:hypothetical protein